MDRRLGMGMQAGDFLELKRLRGEQILIASRNI
jgi:hypothetical protein